jgi:Peptidase family M48
MEARTGNRRKGPGTTARVAEIALLVAGCVVLVLAFHALRATDGGPASRTLGRVGLGLLALAGISWTLRSFRTGGRARLPTTVGRTRLSPDRGLRCWMALTFALAVGIPIAVAVLLTALVDDGWAWIAGGLFLGAIALMVERSVGRRAQGPVPMTSGEPVRLLERLCIRADMPVPALELDATRVPIAWTAAGKIHLSEPLLRSLDRAELEAVLAHELAHLAHVRVLLRTPRVHARMGVAPPRAGAIPRSRALGGRRGGQPHRTPERAGVCAAQAGRRTAEDPTP